jgi:hypothetical protein
MIARPPRGARALLVLLALAAAGSAQAIPAFARKYGTSCQTCHTAYPRLAPFGEAFRRNGYRFPGVDSDFMKQETVALGQDASKKSFPNAVWPAWVPSVPGFAYGANGSIVTHPTKGSDGFRADNGTQFSLDNLISEAHIWGGGSIDDTITFWMESTITSGGASLERAQVLFNDLFGPQHYVNLVVGRGIPTLSSFSPHSSYLADTQFVTFPLPAVYGSTDAGWQLADNFNLIEVNGVVEGRFEYGVGLNAGSHVAAIRPTENVYGHVGVKLGGMRLDGEGSTGSTDVARPWAETALTVHGFAAHANTEYTSAVTAGPGTDVSNAVGLGARLQVDSFELYVEGYLDKHDHASGVLGADGRPGGVGATVLWGEASYIVYPWLIPALRVEHVVLDPDNGGASTNSTRVLPGVVFLVRPNVKLTLVAAFERASGLPDQGGSWGAVGSQLAPADPSTSESFQFSSLNLGLAFAF